MHESTRIASSSWLGLRSTTIKVSGSSCPTASESALLYYDPGAILIVGRDYELTGSEEGKEILITASDSLEDRYDPNARSLLTFHMMSIADM